MESVHSNKLSMQEESELEQFLASSSAQGQVDSRGTFTILAAEALRKMAEHQLPFAGAWAVKIIQSIVAGPGSGAIRVDLTATEIRFFFQAAGFTLDEFSQAFQNPELSANLSLRYLLSGLWPVGLKERWRFQVALPEQKDTAIWDGERMHRVTSLTPRAEVCISIMPSRTKGARSWVTPSARSGARNAEILFALSRRCYVCPRPLSVDGRRIDSLQRAQHHGCSEETYPQGIGFADGEFPPLRLPPGTFAEGANSLASQPSRFRADGGGWRTLGEKRIGRVSPRESAGLAFLWSIHMKRLRSGESVAWHPSQGPSTVYWVLDGALVAEEPLMKDETHCSVGCFVSAQGLETDLSTFHLLDSPLRRERLTSIRKAVSQGLRSIERERLVDYLKEGRGEQTITGGVLISIGLGSYFWAAPVGVMATLMGVILMSLAGTSNQDRQRQLRDSVQELRARLQV